MKTKSIISANIDTDLVKQLKGKTKGTRSRTIERALRKYLDDQDSFALEDVPTLKLIMELAFRKELPDSTKQYLRSLYNEVK
jgi:metal-responsive CopG/Arc/MetJ family transcriptional regulator